MIEFRACSRDNVNFLTYVNFPRAKNNNINKQYCTHSVFINEANHITTMPPKRRGRPRLSEEQKAMNLNEKSTRDWKRLHYRLEDNGNEAKSMTDRNNKGEVLYYILTNSHRF